MQTARKLSEFLERCCELLAGGGEDLGGAAWVGRDPGLREPQGKRQRDESLLRAVVEIPLEPAPLRVNAKHTVARVTIPLAGNGTDSRSMGALQTLRERILPATVGKVPGATYAVTGGTANSVDANALLKHSWPLVFAFVLTLAFVLLLVSFRSIVIAAKAIVLNLLSVAAAYGVLVAVLQYGCELASCTSPRTAASRSGCRSSCS